MKKTITKLSEEENLKLAYELKRETEEYVDKNFNMVQLAVYEKCCRADEKELFEMIEQEDIDWEDIADHEGHYGDEKWIEAQQEEYAEISDHPAFESVRDNKEQNNYPMWNTLFEFKHEPSEEEIQAARDAGFGVITGMEDFNTTLFARGCGYSFYGAHWIPFYLNIPWRSAFKDKYKGVKYDMM